MSPVRKIVVDQPLLKVGCTLGEAPIYDASTSTLHFVDIEESKVYHLNTISLNYTVERYADPITCLTLRKNGSGVRFPTPSFSYGIDKTTVNPHTVGMCHFQRLRASGGFNDGACDSKGRFFAGTIYSKDKGIPGQLWRYDPADGSCVVVDEGPFTDSNGLGWSPDEKTLYFTDSLANIIYAYDYDDGNLSNRRVFADARAQGLPDQTFADGLCIDSEGCVWSARWNGSRIIRFSKDGGIDAEILFPTVLRVTACCFGGPNEDQMFVTTAHCGAINGDASRQTKYPDSGHLFVVNLAGKYKGGKWRYPFTG